MDNELILFDRLNVIRDINKKYNLEDNSYISFSGGKDSTILHYLIDMALPNNKIPRVFSNTGIEYNSIVSFVKKMKEKDERFEIITPSRNIKKMLDDVGYPFKSKEHSLKLHEFQVGNRDTKSLKKYLGEGAFSCPKKLKYQFSDDFKLKISQFCCVELKKKPFKKYSKEYGKSIVITGMQRSEGGQRTTLNCIMTDKDNNLVKFHPLAPVNDVWEQWFIDKYNVELCELYYPPYNFTRTGCKGCPYNLHLQRDMDAMKQLGMDAELRQMEIIWHPIYSEMRRIGYRLNKEEGEQMTIFDILGEEE